MNTRVGGNGRTRGSVANALLDFMFVPVRNPDAAARCAADPAQSIVETHLTDVASAAVCAGVALLTTSAPTGQGIEGTWMLGRSCHQ